MNARTHLGIASLALCLAACATTSAWTPPTAHDTRDDPAALRAGYGNEELHTWWPVTPNEIAAMRGLPAARRGDARALLALALVSSGDHRDAASHAEYTARLERFIAELRPTMAAAADDWHRGYELNRAMHRELFGEQADLSGYQFEQGRLTGIFTSGRYNCLSSTLLYVVLARAFDLPVRAVAVPTHVFVEMGAPGGKVFEIETTSATGFDLVHDERFYREDAAGWSGRRGLRPVTWDEYQHRKLLEPYQLMALAMRDARSGEEADRPRLHELAAIVDPDDVVATRERLQFTNNESLELYDGKAWRTLARLYDVISPSTDAVAARASDVETAQLGSWLSWYYAHALMIVGRPDEAMARVKDGYGRIDAAWPDAEKLRQNWANVLNDRLCGFIQEKDYARAVALYGAHRDACRADKVCTDNVSVAYSNQAVDAQNAGDWQSARLALQACVAALPEDARCRDSLADLESRHRF